MVITAASCTGGGLAPEPVLQHAAQLQTAQHGGLYSLRLSCCSSTHWRSTHHPRWRICQLYLSAVRSCRFLADELVLWKVLLQHGLDNLFATLVRLRDKIYVRRLLLNAQLTRAKILLDDCSCCQGSLTSHAQALLQVNFHGENLAVYKTDISGCPFKSLTAPWCRASAWGKCVQGADTVCTHRDNHPREKQEAGPRLTSLMPSYEAKIGTL